jgi:hypothetical protein
MPTGVTTIAKEHDVPVMVLAADLTRVIFMWHHQASIGVSKQVWQAARDTMFHMLVKLFPGLIDECQDTRVFDFDNPHDRIEGNVLPGFLP